MLNPSEALALALDPALLLQAQGLEADPWQRDLLLCPDRQMLLNCCRQSGKSTVVAALALHTALFKPKSLTLILSPSQRQSHELFRKVTKAYDACGRPVPTTQDTPSLSRLELANGSRIVGLPGKEGTIRGYSDPALLIVDEASRVADDLYRSIRPMLTVSKGRIVLLSTPFGRRGFFYQEWEHGGTGFRRFKVSHAECPRISEEFIAQEEASLGKPWVDQEYRCLFTALEGLVYPDFDTAVWDSCEVGSYGAHVRRVGGIDFGWRNPFAAIWGTHDQLLDVLTITGERYLRETPLHEHTEFLRSLKPHAWYADPAHPSEIGELRRAGLKVRRADNDIKLGIAAVSARIRTKRLRINRTGCPNLISESRLYRYPAPTEVDQVTGEKPIDAHNHALGALRYLISKLDQAFIAKLRRLGKANDSGPLEDEEIEAAAEAGLHAEIAKDRERKQEALRSIWNTHTWEDDDLWTPI